MSNERQATLIKLFAVVASATRWIGALAASEGLYVPAEWLWWWRILSFVMAAAMAAVEAMAFSYALRAWRYMRPDSPQARRMMALVVLAAVTFVAVMAPSIVAYVQHQEINQVLSGLGLWLWGVAVTLSTVVVLGMVGYAQGRVQSSPVQSGQSEPVSSPVQSDTQSSPGSDAGRKLDAMNVLTEHLSVHPDASVSELEQLTGRSRSTVYAYLSELEQAGRIRRNGNGRKEDPAPVETAQGGEA